MSFINHEKVKWVKENELVFIEPLIDNITNEIMKKIKRKK
jgi:hypothetical protein